MNEEQANRIHRCFNVFRALALVVLLVLAYIVLNT